MPFCGFNKEMLDGMREFHEGITEDLSRQTKNVEVEVLPEGDK